VRRQRGRREHGTAHSQAQCVPEVAHDVLHTLERRVLRALLPCGRVRGCMIAHRILEDAGAARAEVQLAMRVRIVWVGYFMPRHARVDLRARLQLNADRRTQARE
jgi:hypothetical protein